MQNDENVKKRTLAEAFFKPTIERLEKWIDEIMNFSREVSASDKTIDECNKKEQAANECLNDIAGYIEGRFSYSDVQKAIAECKKLGFH